MITFEVLTPEEKFTDALAEIYTILLVLAEEKSKGTLTTEYHQKYNNPHGNMVNCQRSSETLRLSP